MTPSAKPSLAFRALHLAAWALTAMATRLLRGHKPRPWHNNLLRAYLGSLSGAVINVSGWEDKDKGGASYRDYFGDCSRYVVSNIPGDRGMPATPIQGTESVYLDLEEPLPEDLRGQFDVVYSHTVLEHVYDTQTALRNLADLSRDVVVTVVPFSQTVHYTRSFSDYVRLSPFMLKRFFEEHGFTVLLCACNDQAFFSVYVTMIVSRHPERHAQEFRDAPVSYEVQLFPGRFGRYGLSGLHD